MATVKMIRGSRIADIFDSPETIAQAEKDGFVKYEEEKSVLELKNRLQIGDTLEIIIPGKIEPEEFKIEELWDIETDEKIEFANPGVKGQQVKIKIPIKVDDGPIIRRKK